MPHKPRKVRSGTAAAAEQSVRDKQKYKEMQEAKGKPKKKRPKTNHGFWQQQQEQKQDQDQKEKRQQRQPSERLKHLRVLGLTTAQDNSDAIKRAYRQLALLHHPDRVGGNTEHMKAINDANDFLCA